MEKARSNTHEIMDQFNELYDIIKDINKYASKVASSKEYDEATKNKILDALSIMTRKLCSFTTSWTKYFKSHYPIKIA